MAIVKTKEKQQRIAANLRMPIELQQRIDSVLNKAKQIQTVNKTELICDAIERGLTEIEQQLKAVDKV